MKIGRGSTRLKLGLVVGVALFAFAALFVGGASAQPTGAPADWSGLPANAPVFDPQETNVPYLAWRGENVRLVDCIPHDEIVTAGVSDQVDPLHYSNNGLDVNLTLYDYTTTTAEGQLIAPVPVQGSARVFYDYQTHRICAAQDWNSAKPGIAIFKLSVSYSNEEYGISNLLLGQHDFMVGWMGIQSVDVTNSNSASNPVTEDPGTDPGNSANVLVTGYLPDQEFADDFGLPSPLVMPNDWAAWANAMATTGDYLNTPFCEAGPTAMQAPTLGCRPRPSGTSTTRRVRSATRIPTARRMSTSTLRTRPTAGVVTSPPRIRSSTRSTTARAARRITRASSAT